MSDPESGDFNATSRLAGGVVLVVFLWFVLLAVIWASKVILGWIF